ncbi:MAG: hypothetical protein F6K62_23800 [Sphaerospermopsis sp. SIO1G2]|nr:hypothetical protein [Sphaerospermopsis sp. SIO1G2]
MPDIVLALGKFNALHLGHRRLVECARQLGQPYLLHLTGMAAALGWAPRPPLLDDTSRQQLLHRWQVSELTLAFAAVRDMPAADFITMLVQQHQVAAVVCGNNCRIGRDRHADADWLVAHGPSLGVQVEVVPLMSLPVQSSPEVPGASLNQHAPENIISSTAIRAMLAEGNVAAAQAALGRPYRLRGVVIRGDQRGRTLGFPTANVDQVVNQLPALGVYAAWATLADGTRWQAAVNIGRLPTVDGARSVTVEAHLLAYQGDCYGQEIVLDLQHRLRPERRFDSLAQLQAQIAADVTQVASML